MLLFALLSFPDLAAAETYRQLTAHVTMTAPPRLFYEPKCFLS